MNIVQRSDRYGVKVYDRARKRYEWGGTHTTREQAEDAGRRLEAELGIGTPSVREWGEVWLSDYARPAPATRLVYRQAVKRIVKDLGGASLGSVDRRRARALALQWPRNVSAVARTMWGDAVRDGVCLVNPWTNMRLRQSRGRKDIRALSEQELLELADVAEKAHGGYGSEARAIILTLGYSGLRPGELCALQWDDLDPRSQEMTVRRSLDSTGQLKAPKNGQARTIVVPPVALKAILSLPRSLDGYVFHSVHDRRLSKANLWYLWRPVRAAWEALGRPGMELYVLRHTAATIALERGLDAATVAQQLGHRDGGKLILERYGHPREDRARERLKMAFASMPESVERAREERRAG